MRVLFIYPKDCAVELQRYRSGLVPSHRLWGQIELENLGHHVEMCPPVSRFFEVGGRLGLRVGQALWVIANQKKFDGVVAVHEISALLLLLLKRIRVISVPIVVINMAILHSKHTRGIRRHLWKAALKCADQVVSLAEAQVEPLRRSFHLRPLQMSVLSMPVDHRFFDMPEENVEQRFCLSVGTNDGKDFETLLEALPLGERLVIVTDSYNAAKIRKHRCFGIGIEVFESMPMEQLRRLYQEAGVVVIPLADSAHGSGHTVFVENQALGKILIVSGTRHMREYIESGSNCVEVPVGDAVALRYAIQEALNEPERFASMRRRARTCAVERFSAEQFGIQLEALLERVVLNSTTRTPLKLGITTPPRREMENECLSRTQA